MVWGGLDCFWVVWGVSTDPIWKVLFDFAFKVWFRISWFICFRRWCIDKLGFFFMQTKHLCVLVHIWTKAEVGAPWNRFMSSKIFLLAGRCFFCGSFMLFLSCFCYAFVRVCLLMPCGHLLKKGWPLGSRLWGLIVKLFFPLVSWVRCGAGLYRFLIFALFLTFTRIVNKQLLVLLLFF